MFADSDSISVYKERSWVSPHRSLALAFSAVTALLLALLVLSPFLFPEFLPALAIAFAVSVAVKAVHHRMLFRAVLKREGVLFAAYCLLMLYLTSFFAMAGFAWGRLKGIFPRS
jgi:hypothetical protein